jgi:hypothetical protein
MKTLNDNWITESHIDFEYKKYILLANLQEVDQNLTSCKLYPVLADLLAHYRYTLAFKENKDRIANNFPKRIAGIDVDQLQLQYEKLLNDDAMIKEIETIINFSLPKFKYYLEEGKKIYDFIETHLQISSVGVIPLHIQEGYLLLKDVSENNIKAYLYTIRLFNTPEENYRAIYTDFLDEYPCNYSNTFENIKIHLLKKNPSLPNPATYAIDSDMAIPLQETYLPIAKRILVRHIS